jgi:hypothetical protein
VKYYYLPGINLGSQPLRVPSLFHTHRNLFGLVWCVGRDKAVRDHT